MKAPIAASGDGKVSLAGASTLFSSDARFPISGGRAAQKLCVWSIHVDLFRSPNNDVSISVRSFVTQVGPALELLGLY